MGWLDKIAKKTGNKAAISAVETVQETLNDKFGTYMSIIKIGLTASVIVFGSKKINSHAKEHAANSLPYPQQPIIINNYISERGSVPYGGKAGQNYQRNQNVRQYCNTCGNRQHNSPARKTP